MWPIAHHACRLGRRARECHPMSDTLARPTAALSDRYRLDRELTPRHMRQPTARPPHVRSLCPTAATRRSTHRMRARVETATRRVSPSCASLRSRRCATVPCVAAARSVSSRALDDREPHPHERPRPNVSRRRSRGHAQRTAAQPGCIPVSRDARAQRHTRRGSNRGNAISRRSFSATQSS